MTPLPALLLSLTVSIQANSTPAQTPLNGLFQCQTITSSEERNRCFSNETAKLQRATEAGEIIVIDQKVAADRSAAAFGLRQPDVLSTDFDVETPQQVTSTLASSAQFAEGKYRFTLADGSTWAQTDSDPIRLRPRDGATVTVRRAALGSYMLRIERGRDIRVQRVN